MLTSKQRAGLKSMAAKITPVVQIGKSGAAPEVVQGIDEVLEARELVKIAVLDNCFEEVRDIANMVAERTRSDVVQVIGRKFVLYRKSKTKPTIEI